MPKRPILGRRNGPLVDQFGIRYFRGVAQIFETPSGEKFAIVPLAEYEALVALRALDHSRRGILLPPEILAAIGAGQHPVRVLRRWRGLSQKRLAEAANLSNSYLSRVENGWLTPGNRTRKALAQALDIPEILLVEG
jgi:DNA-binding XRE family transcriptional regulator